MTDLAIIGLVVVFTALGYWTGIIRRVIGFAAVYLGFFAATQSGPTAASVVLQAFPSWAIPDALMLGYFIVVALMVVLVDVLASFYHGNLQLAAVLFDRGSGAIIGAATALIGITLALSLLLSASQPVQGSPDGAQIQIHDAISKSVLGPALVGSLGRISTLIFLPVIPSDPETYFNNQEARLH
ncbi:MAG TPA: CvpA family protein [Candidatus Dormibacteraeota bacterium]